MNRWWKQFRQLSAGRQVAAWIGVAFVSLILIGVASGPEEVEPTSAISGAEATPTSSIATASGSAQQRAEERAAQKLAAKKAAAKRARARTRKAKARRAARAREKRRAELAAKRRAAARARQLQAQQEAASQCDPNYSGACLDPNASDYDCEGGSGDGPMYTGPVESVGSDPYDLDADGDGYACE